MDAVARQVDELKGRYPEAHLEDAPDGQRVLVVPAVGVGQGWNLADVTIRVLVPVGYPNVPLDCFYTDAALRLATGAEPANSSIQSVFGGQFRWFSWHLGAWAATNGSLEKYLRFCKRRLRDTR